MKALVDTSEIQLSRGRRLTRAAIGAPLITAGIPAAATVLLMILFGASPPAAVTILFFGIVLTVLGLVIGLGTTGYLLYQRNKWMRETREAIAVDGIRAHEVDWFRAEMRPAEKRMLDGLRRSDMLLADAYAETLASRLTASRIIKSSRKELQSMLRRQAKVKQLKTNKSEEYAGELAKDIAKVNSIVDDAKVLLAEAEGRLQMIEGTSVRGSVLAGNEQVIKRLTEQASQLPLALEQAKIADEIRKELEEEVDQIGE